MSKQLNKASHQPDGAQHEPTQLELWLIQPTAPIDQEHQQFLDQLVKATTANFNSQQ